MPVRTSAKYGGAVAVSEFDFFKQSRERDEAANEHIKQPMTSNPLDSLQSSAGPWQDDLAVLEGKASAWDEEMARAEGMRDHHAEAFAATTADLEDQVWLTLHGSDDVLDTLGSVTLHEGSLEIDRVRHLFDGPVEALAETRGAITRQKRSMLTRSAYGAVTFGVGFFATKTKKHDDREVCLVVETPNWAEIALYSPALQKDAVRFAKEIERVGNEWVAAAPTRRREAAALAARIKEVRAANQNLVEQIQAADEVLRELEAKDDVRNAVKMFKARYPDYSNVMLYAGALSTVQDIERLIAAHTREGVAGGANDAADELRRESGQVSARTVQLREFRTESLGLMVRRSFNDAARTLGRWQSRPPSVNDDDHVIDLDELIAEAAAGQDEPGPPLESAAVPAAPDPVEQLQKLADLHAQGVLSAEEFTAAKAKLLN